MINFLVSYLMIFIYVLLFSLSALGYANCGANRKYS